MIFIFSVFQESSVKSGQYHENTSAYQSNWQFIRDTRTSDATVSAKPNTWCFQRWFFDFASPDDASVRIFASPSPFRSIYIHVIIIHCECMLLRHVFVFLFCFAIIRPKPPSNPSSSSASNNIFSELNQKLARQIAWVPARSLPMPSLLIWVCWQSLLTALLILTLFSSHFLCFSFIWCCFVMCCHLL